MSKSIAISILAAAAVLLTVPLSGCSEGPSPTPNTTTAPEARNGSVPTVTAQAEATRVPSAAPTVTAVPPATAPEKTGTHALNPSPTATSSSNQRPLTVDDYLSRCAQPVDESVGRATYGNLHSAISKEADKFSALTPPDVLSEWHALEMDVNRKILELIDSRPKGTVIDLANLAWIAAETRALEQKRNMAADQLPHDIRQRALGTGCMRESTVIAFTFYGPESEVQRESVDHGDDIKGATTLVVGGVARGVLGDELDLDTFRFEAEEGQSYQIGIQPFAPFHPQLILLDAEGREEYSTGTLDQVISWEAPESKDYYVVVKTTLPGTGGYVLYVSQAVDDHGNDPSSATEALPGKTIGGNIGSLIDADYFRFAAEADRNYEIVSQLLSLEVSPNVDLFDSDGSMLASTKFKGGIQYPTIRWQAPESGDYYVRVTSQFPQMFPGGETYLLDITLVR